MSTMTKRRTKPIPPASGPNPWPARLKRLRKRRKLTQTAAASLARVSASTWISWENDQRRPSGPALELLKLAFPELA